MINKEQITKQSLKTDLPDIKVGDIVKVFQKISGAQGAAAGKGKAKTPAKKEGERIQVFEGIVLAAKHGKGISGTITVRRIISGVGVERIFPLHSPALQKIEIVGRNKVRRAKLYYLRSKAGKKAKLQRKSFVPETTATETEEPNAKNNEGQTLTDSAKE
ncbi:MAG: 50S ribosomal protein L19 [Candidatus Pacebacteria bacterium]|nr:50S ribosomal protein L19 [Candidatus Paceibacterota bacterium]